MLALTHPTKVHNAPVKFKSGDGAYSAIACSPGFEILTREYVAKFQTNAEGFNSFASDTAGQLQVAELNGIESRIVSS